MNDPARPHPLQATLDAFIQAANDFDIEAALALFAPSAVIDDPSTGHTFTHHAGVRDYLERYFVGYRTVTRLLSVADLGKRRICVRVDFAGDFGHEIGLLDVVADVRGRISRIDAELE
ncbi:nuclear transport factor 2 family protein [Xanthomonas hydrangeae]|uniref:Nuclear transport factor 2 family protein n=1 Tax=Xanthomonas hydrangeae TaxID=2775159 RepID=A0AAU0BBT3_9XANT|nr:nuclear transport factor 2 family protein [Xanthomonas hydrangeae]WOB49426.1 nuclear transport factor 2 family protein [Xanthomonas hydrangeae]